MRIPASVLLAVLAIGAARPTTPDPKGEAQLAKLIDGRVPGQPTDCIPVSEADDSTVVDHTAIVYRAGSQLWVNRPQGDLSALDDDAILVTELHISELCNIDVVHLVDRVSRFPRGFVSLGRFVPYTRPKN